MTPALRLIAPVLCTAALFASPAAVAEPEWKREITPTRLGPHPRLGSKNVEYHFSWRGILRAGTMRLEFAPRDANKPGAYVIKSHAHSQGAAAALFPYNHNFWAELHTANLRPRFFQGTETDRRETTTTTVRYFPDRVECSETTRQLRGGRVTQEDRVFRFADVHDIFSAMLHVRSQTLVAGQRITYVVQPFDNPYLVRVTSHGQEVHNGRNAIRLTIAMQRIDRDTLELREYRKLNRDATMWLSDDADRLPIELRAAVFIGDVRAVMQ